MKRQWKSQFTFTYLDQGEVVTGYRLPCSRHMFTDNWEVEELLGQVIWLEKIQLVVKEMKQYRWIKSKTL